MELKQLEAFVNVAEAGSFSGAASKMYLTQPTISTHIAGLEKELGIRLFERTTKTLRLTGEGRELLGYALRMLELKDVMNGFRAGEREKTIRIGASTIPSAYLLPAVTKKFAAGHKDMCVNIRQGNSREIEEMVRDGRVAFGVTGRESMDPELVSEAICEDEMVIALPAEAAFKKLLASKASREQKMARIMKNPLILREEGSGTKDAAEKILESYENGGIIMRSNDQESIKQMVARGAGISLMSAFAAKDMAESGRILTFTVTDLAPRSFYLVCRKDAKHESAEKAYMKILKECY